MPRFSVSPFALPLTAALCFCAFAPAARAQAKPKKPAKLSQPAPPPKGTKGKKPAAPVIAPPAATEILQNLTITLRFMKPSEFVVNLVPSGSAGSTPEKSLPPGLLRVSPDDVEKRVFVQGTPEAVALLQKIAALLDVAPRQVVLQLRILRAAVNAETVPDFAKTAEVVTTVSSFGPSNLPVLLYAIGDGQLFKLYITPHVNSDETITMSADLSQIPTASLVGTQVKQESRLWTRRTQSGTPLVAASLPNFKNRATAFYLEVTPTALPRTPAPSAPPIAPPAK